MVLNGLVVEAEVDVTVVDGGVVVEDPGEIKIYYLNSNSFKSVLPEQLAVSGVTHFKVAGSKM